MIFLFVIIFLIIPINGQTTDFIASISYMPTFLSKYKYTLDEGNRQLTGDWNSSDFNSNLLGFSIGAEFREANKIGFVFDIDINSDYKPKEGYLCVTLGSKKECDIDGYSTAGIETFTYTIGIRYYPKIDSYIHIFTGLSAGIEDVSYIPIHKEEQNVKYNAPVFFPNIGFYSVFFENIYFYTLYGFKFVTESEDKSNMAYDNDPDPEARDDAVVIFNNLGIHVFKFGFMLKL